jgi:outer membrane receptor protein involved in Fe transport
MSSKSRTQFGLFSGASLAALLLAPSALAQQAAPAPKPAAPQTGGIEEVVVTAERREAQLQNVPIAVSAFTPETLDKLQIAGGPDLVTAVPSVSFSKGNFTGYNFAIRGIGSKSVGASGDAGTSVHLNGAPLVANNLFESEFFDVERVEVLRGPQGTLYGRNATGGVVNVITKKPSNKFEAFAQGTGGNYGSYRGEGMINVPLGESGGLRIAGAYLKRDGYAKNATTGNTIDGRDLWSLRATLGYDLGDTANVWVSYEKFKEDDNRLRSGKQYCIKDPTKTSLAGVPVSGLVAGFINQGCLPGDMLKSRETLNSQATLGGLLGNVTGGLITGDAFAGKLIPEDIRTIEAAFDPRYRANSEVFQLNFKWDLTDNLQFNLNGTRSTGSVFSNEDYNKVNAPGTFNPIPGLAPGGVVSDPQLGASNRFRTYDISQGDSTQTSVEARIASSYDGRFNYSLGYINIKYEAQADYYVFSNTLTANALATGNVVDFSNPTGPTLESRVNNSGRNYYLNAQPYFLDASAVFGEIYLDLTDNLKFTGGLRRTSDDKRVVNNQPALLTATTGAPGSLNCTSIPVQGSWCPLSATAPTNAYYTNNNLPNTASFTEMTGRAGFDWKVAEDNLLYAFYSRGYKGGGVNPAPSLGVATVKPTFDPEFVTSYEVGSKNKFADGRVQLNLTGFYYDYQGYQISKIVNRTSLNENVDAKVQGLEVESIFAPNEKWLFTLNAGFNKSEILKGESINSLDIRQGDPAFTVIKASNTSNCMVPTAALAQLIAIGQTVPGPGVPNPTGLNGFLLGAGATNLLGACAGAFSALGVTPSAGKPVQLKGKELPNAPSVTASFSANYVQPLGDTWNMVFNGSYYYQGESYARIYNTISDELPSWQSANFSLALENDASNLTVKLFVKNAFEEEAVTDKYYTDDSSGLFTNAFFIEPRTYGLTVSKKW